MFRRASRTPALPPGAGAVNDVGRMLRGQPVIEQEIIRAKLDDRRVQDEQAHAAEQRTIAELLQREEQLGRQARALAAELSATQAELEKSRLGETQLRKALDLAATRLHAAQASASEARREHEIMQSKLYDSQTDVNRAVNELRARPCRPTTNQGIRFNKRKP